MKQLKLYLLARDDEFFLNGHWYSVDHHDGLVSHVRTQRGDHRFIAGTTKVRIKDIGTDWRVRR